jgi:hypothetical protein
VIRRFLPKAAVLKSFTAPNQKGTNSCKRWTNNRTYPIGRGAACGDAATRLASFSQPRTRIRLRSKTALHRVPRWTAAPMEPAPSEAEIQAFLAGLRPPEFPDEVFDSRETALGQIVDWKKSTASSLLAGLLTDPRFHANTIRLEWLQRLVLSKSAGKRKPQQRDLSTALNEGLDRANVLRLEDPIEDLFCDLIATGRGNFRIFVGVWEGAGPYTQTLLDAFETLPAGGLKDQGFGFGLRLVTDQRGTGRTRGGRAGYAVIGRSGGTASRSFRRRVEAPVTLRPLFARRSRPPANR